MKTRVIQNDPDEPGRHDARVDPAAEPKPTTNLAGRMGRWSAHHRKIAIFGWLAFVFVSFAVGMFVVGAKQATDVSGPANRAARSQSSTRASSSRPARAS